MAKCQVCGKHREQVLHPVTLSVRSYYEGPVHVCLSCAEDIEKQVLQSR